MYFETVQLVQMSGALLAAIIIFFAAYAAPLRISVGALLVLVPFQLVDTTYGSSNMVMTYVLVGALMLKGRLQYAPMLGSVIAVILAYMISMSQLPRSLFTLHGIEILALVSTFLVFMLAYNLARESRDPRFIINVLIVANVLSIIYCFIQLAAGPGESLEFFGRKEFSMNENRGGGDARLVGPFATPGITAAYFMAMTLILIYEVVHAQHRRRILVAVIIVLNVVMILATSSRGSFLVLLAGLLGFSYLFRAELGFGRIVKMLVAATIVLVGTATIIAAYTDFGQMFDRLAKTTETEDGLPSTRSVVWPIAWENIKEKPLLGHGPRLLGQHELRFRSVPPEQLVGPYPHNLYLYLLVTVGILGTVCMLFFLFGVASRVYQGAKRGYFSSEYERGWVLVGTIVIVAFLVDELKIEFLRYTTVDYGHFVFALFGIFLGWSDAARANAQAAAMRSKSQDTASSVLRDLPPVMAGRSRVK
jgi:O-antigen ligase